MGRVSELRDNQTWSKRKEVVGLRDQALIPVEIDSAGRLIPGSLFKGM